MTAFYTRVYVFDPCTLSREGATEKTFSFITIPLSLGGVVCAARRQMDRVGYYCAICAIPVLLLSHPLDSFITTNTRRLSCYIRVLASAVSSSAFHPDLSFIYENVNHLNSNVYIRPLLLST